MTYYCKDWCTCCKADLHFCSKTKPQILGKVNGSLLLPGEDNSGLSCLAGVDGPAEGREAKFDHLTLQNVFFFIVDVSPDK
jgi:hypothetical protein